MVGEERRHFMRVCVDQPASIGAQGGRGVACRISDVSVNGMKVHLPSQLEESASVTLHVRLDCELTLKIQALVAWRNATYGENVYGLTLADIKDTEKEVLLKMVQQYFPVAEDEFLKEYIPTL